MIKRFSNYFGIGFLSIFLALSLNSKDAFSAAGNYVTVIIENKGIYPITFELPKNISSSDFDTDPQIITEKGTATKPVIVDGDQSIVLFMILSKPVVNAFDALKKEWGFNINYCIQEGSCDQARISGTIRSTTTFNWSQGNNVSLPSTSEITSSELNAYAQAKGALSAMLNIVGGILGMPGSGGMIGGLPDSQSFKVTLTQKEKTRFSFDMSPLSDNSGNMQVDMAVKRIFPNRGSFDKEIFSIASNNVISNGLNVTQNTCVDATLRQCNIRVFGRINSANMYDAVFGARDNAGTTVTVNLGYSRGALMVLNKLPFPTKISVRLGRRYLFNTEIMPGGHEDLREIIPLLQGENCNDAQDPFMPSRVMSSCLITFSIQSDGGPDIFAQVNCRLAARNGTVQAGDIDQMNLYLLTNCTPAVPVSLSKASPGLYKMYVNNILPIAGMYKMISIEMAKSR